MEAAGALREGNLGLEEEEEAGGVGMQLWPWQHKQTGKGLSQETREAFKVR